MVLGGMVFIGAVAAAILAVPGLARGVALATARRPDARLLAAVSVGAALLIAWRAEGLLHGFALALVALAGIAAGWIDAYERRLPDVLVLPMYPAVGVLLLATGDGDAMLRAVLCAAAGMAVYGIGCAAGQLGFGDVKLAGLLGLVLGWMSWQSAVIASLAAVLIGGGQAVAVLCLRRKEFPFGPAMLLGAAAALAVDPWVQLRTPENHKICEILVNMDQCIFLRIARRNAAKSDQHRLRSGESCQSGLFIHIKPREPSCFAKQFRAPLSPGPRRCSPSVPPRPRWRTSRSTPSTRPTSAGSTSSRTCAST